MYQNIWIYPFVNVCNSSDIGHFVDKYQTTLERTIKLLKDGIQKKETSLQQLHQYHLEIINYKHLILFYNQQVSIILYFVHKFIQDTLIL